MTNGTGSGMGEMMGDMMKEMGVEVLDTPQGVDWKIAE